MTPIRLAVIVAWLLAAVAMPVSGGAAADPSGTAQPARGNAIVFASNAADSDQTDIYQMNADGTGRTRLTQTRALEFDAVWSPDQKRIAFAACEDPTRLRSEIYVMNADGSQRRRVTSLNTIAFAPTWSSDGRHLAFSTIALERGNERAELFRIQLEQEAAVQRLGEGVTPRWSPDGNSILYTAQGEKGGADGLRLLVMNSMGGNVRALPGSGAMLGTWSPTGQQIAYTQVRNPEIVEIHIMKADGSQSTQLTSTAGMDDLAPQWSPDGRYVFYCGGDTNRPGTLEIYRLEIYRIDMATSGRPAVRLTQNDSVDLLSGLAVPLLISGGVIKLG